MITVISHPKKIQSEKSDQEPDDTIRKSRKPLDKSQSGSRIIESDEEPEDEQVPSESEIIKESFPSQPAETEIAAKAGIYVVFSRIWLHEILFRKRKSEET